MNSPSLNAENDLLLILKHTFLLPLRLLVVTLLFFSETTRLITNTGANKENSDSHSDFSLKRISL